MNLVETLLKSAQDHGGPVQSAALRLGVDGDRAQTLLKTLVPALSGGIRKNTVTKAGVESLSKALRTGNHQRYLDDPAALSDAAAVTDGNAILGHFFGSKDVSRKVAAEAAAATGLDLGVVKRFLPLAAAATMGALSKASAAGSQLGGRDTDGPGLIGRLLDSDGDGSIIDNLLAFGKRRS
jgi:hypothetical protein